MLGSWGALPSTRQTEHPSAISGVAVGIRGTLGDIDPLNKAPFQRARSRVKKGPL